ncbi:MAG: hypothetical protein M3443_15045 [Actinomycetota bacterium]|nr:hypothetical protein [Actinomycetota bacterium]
MSESVSGRSRAPATDLAHPSLAAMRLPPPTQWFVGDAERHLLDRPRWCPQCSTSMVDGKGLITEFWTAEDRVFYCWCGACGWSGNIVNVERVVGHEPEH